MSQLPIQDLVQPIIKEFDKRQEIYENHKNVCFEKMKRYSKSGHTECTYFIPSLGTDLTLTREDITECIEYIKNEFSKYNIHVERIKGDTIYINWKQLIVEEMTKHIQKK